MSKYKRLLVNKTTAGFSDTGFICLADVSNMSESTIKEKLLNIFHCKNFNTNEELDEAFETFNSDEAQEENEEFSNVGIVDREAFDNIIERSIEISNILGLTHVESDDSFIDKFLMDESEMSSFNSILKSLFTEEEQEEGLDEWEVWDKFDSQVYSEKTTLRIDLRFSDT